jgi:hypothetical protein
MRILAVAALALAALVLPGAAWADTSLVNPYVCSLSSGQVTRPAGTEIVVRQGFSSKNRGLAQDLVASQTTTIAVNGGAPHDLSDLWSSPFEAPDGSWLVRNTYATGIALAGGESMTFRYVVSVSHQLWDGFTFESGKPAFGGPGTILDVSCTVTGS